MSVNAQAAAAASVLGDLFERFTDSPEPSVCDVASTSQATADDAWGPPEHYAEDIHAAWRPTTKVRRTMEAKHTSRGAPRAPALLHAHDTRAHEHSSGTPSLVSEPSWQGEQPALPTRGDTRSLSSVAAKKAPQAERRRLLASRAGVTHARYLYDTFVVPRALEQHKNPPAFKMWLKCTYKSRMCLHGDACPFQERCIFWHENGA